MPARSKSTASATSAARDRQERRASARSGSASHGSAKVDRDDDERDDQDVGPEADVRQHVRAGVPGDERREDGGERAARAGAQYGGSCAHHGAERLEGVPERGLRWRCSSSARVDVGRHERLDRRREAAALRPARCRRADRRAGSASASTNRDRVRRPSRRRASAARCAARASATASPARRPRVAELEAVRAVDRERVDAEPLQRLEQRVARRGRRTRRPP